MLIPISKMYLRGKVYIDSGVSRSGDFHTLHIYFVSIYVSFSLQRRQSLIHSCIEYKATGKGERNIPDYCSRAEAFPESHFYLLPPLLQAKQGSKQAERGRGNSAFVA